ncbi:flavin reductase family protein [Microbulbifer bruguierae]|uniref:Flavin reductase family protein n=1 Tax=Microbulbifer bruguierae TaxID=3029061 RepID=A0ABY8NEG3_9GAMM|nr:flavin reductase family protein [Microbulbifer bruguierae]WGL16819.1 flavin reductase family protein [Microbulbifer bruguierae]
MSSKAEVLAVETSCRQSEADTTFDPLALRQVFGQFATGVTIVTTQDPAGLPVGMTASSFNSVSLEPPLVLWCIDRNAGCFDAFNRCEHFAIHVLNQAQSDLSTLFARKGVDRFGLIEYDLNERGVPLLREYCARLECSMEHRYEGGDHIIMVGRVRKMHTQEHAPLVFHRGRYAQIA